MMHACRRVLNRIELKFDKLKYEAYIRQLMAEYSLSR
jgi:hypothetical protein